jgi:hypothetical protein
MIAAYPETLHDLWDRFTDWNLVVQIVVGVLLLPWVAATWVWQTDWATLLRALVIAALAIATLSAFTPREG